MMFRRRSIPNVATTLALVLAIAGAGMGGPQMVRPACGIAFEPPKIAPQECGHERSCCCGKNESPRACGCDREQPPTPAAPDDAGRTLKLATWIDAPPAILTALEAKRQSAPRDPIFYSPQRSVQSLLCVWRI
jgi:hypothetical protein